MRSAQMNLAVGWPPAPTGPRVTEASRISSGPADLVRIVPIRDALTVGVGELSWMVFAGAMVLLTLACVNVAALAAARARDRWRDMSIRRAIGARSSDVFRALAAEHVLVVVSGVVVGILLCRPVLHATLERMPAFLLLRDADINARVLIFAALLAIVCLATMAALATVASRGPGLQSSLADGGAATRRGGSLLLTLQIALAIVVITGSTLVVGSLVRVWREDHGFSTSAGVLQMSAPPGATALQIEQLIEQFSHVPGVAQVGGTTGSVLRREIVSGDFDQPEGKAHADMGDYGITPSYFEALGIDLIEGRFPTAAEFRSGVPVAVVSVSAARAYWSDRPALGKRLTSRGQAFTVIGVVGDGRYGVWERDPVGEIYRPLMSVPNAQLRSLVVVPRGGVRLADLSAAFAGACPDCRIYAATSVADALDESIARRRFQAWLFAGFGGIALLITATGMLGLVAMTTARRTREIGIRLALGATRPTVVRQIVRGHLGAVVIGVIAGGLAAAAAVRPLESLLYKTGVYDPTAWSAAVVTLTLVALIGAVLPSIRASRVDVVQVLKPE
jgi:predicted permease